MAETREIILATDLDKKQAESVAKDPPERVTMLGASFRVIPSTARVEANGGTTKQPLYAVICQVVDSPHEQGEVLQP